MNITSQNRIILPSLLRRCMKAYAIKSLIRSVGADLSRIGRSRNWQIIANFEQMEQITALVEQEGEPSWLWVAKLMRKQYSNLSHEALIFIARKNDGITVNELMAKTDCTVAQARKVIDEIEFGE